MNSLKSFLMSNLPWLLSTTSIISWKVETVHGTIRPFFCSNPNSSYTFSNNILNRGWERKFVGTTNLSLPSPTYTAKNPVGIFVRDDPSFEDPSINKDCRYEGSQWLISFMVDALPFLARLVKGFTLIFFNMFKLLVEKKKEELGYWVKENVCGRYICTCYVDLK